MAGEKRGVQDLRGWYWSDFKRAKKQRQSRIDAVFLQVWKFGGCIRLKRQEMAGEKRGVQDLRGWYWSDFKRAKKQRQSRIDAVFLQVWKFGGCIRLKGSFFRQEMAGEKRGVQDLRGWYWSDFKPAKKQRQSRIDAVFLQVWKFGGCIRLKVASLGRKWLGKSVGCKIWGVDTDQIQTSKKTAAFQGWRCSFCWFENLEAS